MKISGSVIMILRYLSNFTGSNDVFKQHYSRKTIRPMITSFKEFFWANGDLMDPGVFWKIPKKPDDHVISLNEFIRRANGHFVLSPALSISESVRKLFEFGNDKQYRGIELKSHNQVVVPSIYILPLFILIRIYSDSYVTNHWRLGTQCNGLLRLFKKANDPAGYNAAISALAEHEEYIGVLEQLSFELFVNIRLNEEKEKFLPSDVLEWMPLRALSEHYGTDISEIALKMTPFFVGSRVDHTDEFAGWYDEVAVGEDVERRFNKQLQKVETFVQRSCLAARGPDWTPALFANLLVTDKVTYDMSYKLLQAHIDGVDPENMDDRFRKLLDLLLLNISTTSSKNKCEDITKVTEECMDLLWLKFRATDVKVLKADDKMTAAQRKTIDNAEMSQIWSNY